MSVDTFFPRESGPIRALAAIFEHITMLLSSLSLTPRLIVCMHIWKLALGRTCVYGDATYARRTHPLFCIRWNLGVRRKIFGSSFSHESFSLWQNTQDFLLGMATNKVLKTVFVILS